MPPIDLSTLKLGKKEPLRRDSLFKFHNYLITDELQKPDPTADWTAKTMAAGGYPMLANNDVGDCVIAAGYHGEQTWIETNGGLYVPTDQMALGTYSAVTGYDPSQTQPDGSNPTDNGTNEETFLDYWRNTGLTGSGQDVDKIYAYMALQQDHQDFIDHTKLAIQLFGFVFLGVALPVTAQGQNIWDVVLNAGADGQAGSWGGHGIIGVAYSDAGMTVVTWGRLLVMTWNFYQAYNDEAFVILSNEWANEQTQANAPSGINFSKLNSDLPAIAA